MFLTEYFELIILYFETSFLIRDIAETMLMWNF